MFKLSVKFHNSGFDLIMIFFVGRVRVRVRGHGRGMAGVVTERKAKKTSKILRERNVKMEMGRKK